MPPKKQILVIEDSSTSIVLCKMLLQPLGYEVDTAACLRNIAVAINKDKPDLIILQLSLMQINGVRMVKLLKTNRKTKDIPLVIISSHHHYRLLHQAFINGADDFVLKPFGLNDLAGKARFWLGDTKREDIFLKV